MKKLRGLFLIGGLACGLGWAGTANAESVDCASDLGSCSVSNDSGDFYSCTCDAGGADGGTGDNEWDGLTEKELMEVCLDLLDADCGDAPPPDGISCENDAGMCTVSNLPDSISCTCEDGSGDGGEGGNNWDEYDDDQLAEECEVQLGIFCGGGDATTSGGETDGGGSGDAGSGDAGDAGSDSGGAEGGAEEGGAEGGADAGDAGDAGDDAADGAGETGGGDGGDSGDDGGKKGCNIGGGGTAGLFALGLLALMRRKPWF